MENLLSPPPYRNFFLCVDIQEKRARGKKGGRGGGDSCNAVDKERALRLQVVSFSSIAMYHTNPSRRISSELRRPFLSLSPSSYIYCDAYHQGHRTASVITAVHQEGVIAGHGVRSAVSRLDFAVMALARWEHRRRLQGHAAQERLGAVGDPA